MNHLLWYASTATFLAVPPVILGIRFWRPSRMPWWLAVPLAVLIGWCAVNAAVFHRFEALGDALRAHGDTPPRELLDAWANDGGPRAFAVAFGWACAAIVFVPWLALYALASVARRRLARQR